MAENLACGSQIVKQMCAVGRLLCPVTDPMPLWAAEDLWDSLYLKVSEALM